MTTRLVALVLLAALALEGCATYPATVVTKGQPPATFERDRRECRERAADEIEPPLVAGLRRKLLWALGGAVPGAGVAAGTFSASGSSDPKEVALVIGGGATLGFVIGSIAGTFKGWDDVSRAVRGRRDVFSECMAERGYRIDPS